MSTKANAAKTSLSYEDICLLIKQRRCIAGLDFGESLMLWCSVSLFSRHDNDDLSDTGSFYHGCPIAPDAPLNGIMSLQVHLSMSIAKRYGMPGLQTKIRLMSKASGNERDFKKFIKRLCK